MRPQRRVIRKSIAAGLFCFLAGSPVASALNVQRLEPAELDQLKAVLAVLDPAIEQRRKDGNAAMLTWDELYAPLDTGGRAFLDAFRALRAKDLGATSHYSGENTGAAQIVAVPEQRFAKDGQETPIDKQYLPKPALAAYERMMAAMEKDIGKRLLVESGYRSPAYQLYLFVFYMSNHDYSITETNRHVALPGYSEHGNPSQQAIDFINQDGINGEYDPPAFEALPEYAWLQANAGKFGFTLSYPRNNPMNSAFEPWHWHYQAPDA